MPLSAKTNVPATVQYAVSSGTAKGGGVDYTLKPGTVTFKTGQTSQTLSIPIVNTKLSEASKTIVVSLSNPVNAALGGNGTFTYTIQNNNPLPSVAFTTTTASGLETVRTPRVPVSLSTVSGQPVTVFYSVMGGTAVNGVNYIGLEAGTLTFPAGVKTENIPLTILDNGVLASSPTVEIALSSATNAALTAGQVFTYTILNSGTPPTIAFQTTTGSGLETKSANLPVDPVRTFLQGGNGPVRRDRRHGDGRRRGLHAQVGHPHDQAR